MLLALEGISIENFITAGSLIEYTSIAAVVLLPFMNPKKSSRYRLNKNVNIFKERRDRADERDPFLLKRRLSDQR